ncbi:MAG TPA: hypothetical protein VJB62_03405 [Patescibacteria group bacterium]|nr:hypothetical protein [Patescibacteria group bacterium]
MKTLKFRVHGKPLNEFTDIDKYFIVPKKMWDRFAPGDLELIIKGVKSKSRVYDIPCQCIGSMHNHRLIDLRVLYKRLELKDNEEVVVGR